MECKRIEKAVRGEGQTMAHTCNPLLGSLTAPRLAPSHERQGHVQ